MRVYFNVFEIQIENDVFLFILSGGGLDVRSCLLDYFMGRF